MLWLALNWKWLLPAAGAAVLGVWLGLTRVELAQTKANWAVERADAAKAAADFAAQSAAKDAANAELARDLEVARAKAIADAAATRGAFADELRRATAAARRRCVPVAPAAPGSDADPPAGSDGGHRSDALGLRIRDTVKSLQADVRECWSWAAAHGR